MVVITAVLYLKENTWRLDVEGFWGRLFGLLGDPN
jgi:hypothetical protein